MQAFSLATEITSKTPLRFATISGIVGQQLRIICQMFTTHALAPTALQIPVIIFLSLTLSSLSAQTFCEPVIEEPLTGVTLLGNGSPGSVTSAQIQSALDNGGAISFDLGPNPSTLVITTTLIASRETVLDGGGLVTLSGNNSRQIMRIINPNPAENAPLFTVTLQNIALIDGLTSGGRGGAIYKEHDFEFPHKVSLKLVNCTFSNNNAPLDASSQDDGGGAFYGELLNRIDIGNCLFDNNSGSNGGALYSLGSLRINIVDSQISNNQAIGTGGNPGNGGNAGGLGVDGGNRLVDVCRSQFIDNQSNAFGAGFFSVMYDQSSRTRFEDVEFQGNIQSDVGQHSGGAYIQDGPWAMERVSFIGNQAKGFGGLFVAGNAPGTLRNATFSNNVVDGLGAAMALSSSATISIINTSIANNVSTTAFASGIAIGFPNQLTLTNVIFDNNTGGNIFVNWAMNNPASFSGGGNMQWPQSRPGGGGAELQVTNDSQFLDAMLPITAGNNGGFVQTLRIESASPARDSGVSNGDVPITDARGAPRIGAVDRGSYEFGTFVAIFIDGFEDL